MNKTVDDALECLTLIIIGIENDLNSPWLSPLEAVSFCQMDVKDAFEQLQFLGWTKDRVTALAREAELKEAAAEDAQECKDQDRLRRLLGDSSG